MVIPALGQNLVPVMNDNLRCQGLSGVGLVRNCLRSDLLRHPCKDRLQHPSVLHHLIIDDRGSRTSLAILSDLCHVVDRHIDRAADLDLDITPAEGIVPGGCLGAVGGVLLQFSVISIPFMVYKGARDK